MVGWIKNSDKLSGNSKRLAMVELMGSVKFRELVMKVENCQVSVVLYKVMGGGVCDFFFFQTLGTNLEMPPCGGFQNDMPRMQQRSMEPEI